MTAVSVKTSPGGSEDYGLVLTDPALDAYNRTRTDRGDAYPSGVSRSYWTPEERAAALDHWTAERMAAAEPARLPDDDPLPTFTRRGTRVQSDPEPPAIVQPLDPRNPDASPLTPEEALPPLDATDGAAWQGPPGDFPARTVGKLFFVRAGKDQHCSAGVVRSEAQNMVFTAGHCLYNDDTDDGVHNPERSTNITFVPGYRDGPSSLGTWTPYARVEFGLWVDDLDTAWDFAILSMDPDPTGAQLETVTGAQGIGFNVRLDGRPAAVLGYSALLFDPAKPSYCAGAIEAESFLTKTLPCTLSHGASGSPWLTQFDHTTGFGLTVAVTSSTKRFHVRSVGFGALHLEAYNLARLG